MQRETLVGLLVTSAVVFLAGALLAETGERWAVAMGLGVGLLINAPIWWRVLEPKPITIEIKRERQTNDILSLPSPKFAELWGVSDTGSLGWGDVELTVQGAKSVNLSRVTVLPSTEFSDGSSWSDALKISSSPVLEIHREGAWNHQWMSSGQVWELTGLPLNLRSSQPLPLPTISVRIGNYEELKTRLNEGQKAFLRLLYTVDSRAGRFSRDLRFEVGIQEPAVEESA